MSFPLPPPMRRALDLAAAGRATAGEVPVGAVVTRGEEIVAGARNAMRGRHDPTAHAEMVAMRAAAAKLGTSRLDGCTLWVTLEPCAMCAAAVSAGADRRRCALRRTTPRAAASSMAPRIFAQPTCHHAPEVIGGIGEAEGGGPAARFFAERRALSAAKAPLARPRFAARRSRGRHGDPLAPPFPWLDVIIILLLVILNGLLAMSELAIVSSREPG